MKIEIVIDHLRVTGVHGSRRRIREAIERELAQKIRETMEANPSQGSGHTQFPRASVVVSGQLDAEKAAGEAGQQLAAQWTACQPQNPAGQHHTTR